MLVNFIEISLCAYENYAFNMRKFAFVFLFSAARFFRSFSLSLLFFNIVESCFMQMFGGGLNMKLSIQISLESRKYGFYMQKRFSVYDTKLWCEMKITQQFTHELLYILLVLCSQIKLKRKWDGDWFIVKTDSIKSACLFAYSYRRHSKANNEIFYERISRCN